MILGCTASTATVLRHRTSTTALFEAVARTGVSASIEPSSSPPYTHTVTTESPAAARQIAGALLGQEDSVSQLLLIGRRLDVIVPRP